MNFHNRTYNTSKWFNIDNVIVNHRP
ncbi:MULTISPECIES: tryptophanase leader peptide [Kluyvera]|uniref:Tryptophanase leader peptide n=1 Tax=Kluyvera ascorbata TaxID=51288 RepID=A0A3N2SAD5_9ENTR|nr:tryptophanase leader peptide [Kluyvera ascorbata]ROU16685.1 tryptophanase leader peptide [Kluyvera ascorbata]HAT7513090.1 tryptophanase leader peptide [Kluyvera ascorbata]HBL0733115.1 tryptophanase leader peptide [Kluyvera ascorbata]HCL5619903.1 tryptophanase leader peptide [Kluyvera ascorbata]